MPSAKPIGPPLLADFVGREDLLTNLAAYRYHLTPTGQAAGQPYSWPIPMAASPWSNARTASAG